MYPIAANLDIEVQSSVYPDENDQILESPVSSSLSDAIHRTSQTKVKMDDFLRQQSQSYYKDDDDDNMSAELRMLKGSEEKLRRDMEIIEAHVHLPQLAYLSDCDSEQSIESSIYSDDENICRRLDDSFDEVKDIKCEIEDLDIGDNEKSSGLLCNEWNENREEASDCDNLVDTIASTLFGSSKSLYTNHRETTLCILGATLFTIRSIVL